ncbi:murein hydrolase activator EnvC family protein [Wenyingzhuangia marina]|uniref:Septal ring factor EnvC, activator of murein hydrolases AmiA and AmiB n=2 Tax=Wenyingzhuangia marina TaxID=1195760 RepID=A0A1M5SKZ4_9FLAO|nr:peptidoglycan DD-metalloendopeptidase family protein [Wenyingzhuangia marina]SHH39181.1 Septal ring factor EnvC, activator of murein hydrolases AmiA and AmiB [Wenyingzhuangia marina]
MSKKSLLFLCAFFLMFTVSFGQTAKQKELEKKRTELQQEIVRVNKLLFQNQKKEENLLGYLNDLNKKIQVRSDLIKAITAEANFLKGEINKNEKQKKALEKELKVLKEDYAEMILKSYKSKSEQSKLMFLLSSEDFFQGYKRFRYMQQYADFRRKQGDTIVAKTEKVEALTRKLQFQKKQKDALAKSNRQEADKIKSEKEAQVALMKKIKTKEKLYLAEIRRKQAEEKKIDAEIERVIKEAIAASRAGKNKTNTKVDVNAKTSGFALTPEGKALANRFEENRGKLPWPVAEGIITRNYGVVPHPTLKGIVIDSKGIHITTKKNATARAVFKGKVLAIQSVSGRYAVYVQHGNYISLYNNLDRVYVSKGQEVSLKQPLGVVFTDKVTGDTELKFQIWKDSQKQNPIYWLARM